MDNFKSILKKTIRVFGVILGLSQLITTLLVGIIPRLIDSRFHELLLEDLPYLTLLIILSICLIVPYRKLKDAKKSLIFFVVFLISLVTLVLFSSQHYTNILWVSSYLIILENLYLSFLQYKERAKIK